MVIPLAKLFTNHIQQHGHRHVIAVLARQLSYINIPIRYALKCQIYWQEFLSEKELRFLKSMYFNQIHFQIPFLG